MTPWILFQVIKNRENPCDGEPREGNCMLIPGRGGKKGGADCPFHFCTNRCCPVDALEAENDGPGKMPTT